MRIALITPGGVDRTGSHRVIPCMLWLIERLTRAGHDVQIIALQQEPRPDRWRLLDADVHNIGSRPRSLRGITKLLALHRAQPFDIVHAFWAGIPGLVGGGGRTLAGIPMVLTLPGGDIMRLPEIRYGGYLTMQSRAITALSLRAASFVTVPSETMRAHARSVGVDALRVPLGVALDRWPAALPRRRDPAKPIRLLQIASLNRVKDQPTLLAAAVRLRDMRLPFTLDIVGEDTLGGEIHAAISRLELEDQVRLQGFQPQTELRDWVERADLMVFSSLSEGAPIAMLEGAVAGVPTVGTAVGHIAEYAPEAAIAVPKRDAAALAAGILRLAGDEDLRLRMAGAAQARALAEDADFTAAAFLDLYERAIRSRKAA
jgi:glycosyltransferase involved in cell wall biosynthesis